MNCDLINAYQRIDNLKTFGIDASYIEKYGEELNDLCMADGKAYMDSVYGVINCPDDSCVRYYKTIRYDCYSIQSTITPNNITSEYYSNFSLNYSKILVGPTQTDSFSIRMKVKVNWENQLVSKDTIRIKSIVPSLKQTSNDTYLALSFFNHTWLYDNRTVDNAYLFDLTFLYYDVTPGYLPNTQYEASYEITIWDGVNESVLHFSHIMEPII